ncbi:MAG: YdcF family protein [Alphaproteobacteria bacterium]|nr:YdcF family protein [Alphaproteobacteria bacterium]
MSKRRIVFIGIISLAFLFWLIGLLDFAKHVRMPIQSPDEKTDAIVSLTGGTDRLKVSVNLLKQGLAEKLFISGVNKKTNWMSIAQTLDDYPQEIVDKITLGHVACNTKENAIESKDWIERNHFKSIRLVTAGYHIPRSKIEFKHELPDIKIVLHPVFPEKFMHDSWWKWPGSAGLMLEEYHKFLAVKIMYLFHIPNKKVDLSKDCPK